jgi:hypothetical protein
VREGIPVTTVARTLLDLADVLDEGGLRGAVDEADRRNLLELGAIEELCERSPGRRGPRALAAILDGHVEPAWDVRTELERRFVELCRTAGLPLPSTNVWVAGFLVDAVWPPLRLAVELDSYRFHRTRASFERDRARDRVLQLAGYQVLRFTWRQLAVEPQAVVGAVRQMLASGSSGLDGEPISYGEASKRPARSRSAR